MKLNEGFVKLNEIVLFEGVPEAHGDRQASGMCRYVCTFAATSNTVEKSGDCLN